MKALYISRLSFFRLFLSLCGNLVFILIVLGVTAGFVIPFASASDGGESAPPILSAIRKIAIDRQPNLPSEDLSESLTEPDSNPEASMEPPYDYLVRMAAALYQVEAALIRAVIQVESNFNARAVSPRGAKGLMQLMPGTAQALGVEDSFDPKENIDAGVRYLRQMLDRFKGDVEMALAAYNAGPGHVVRYGGIPPFPDTRSFIDKVLGAADPTRGIDEIVEVSGQ